MHSDPSQPRMGPGPEGLGPQSFPPPAPPGAYFQPPPGPGLAPPRPYPLNNADTGAAAWFVGLVALIMLPGVSAVIASCLMIGVGLGKRRGSDLAAENGRRAANWGLTYLVVTVLLCGSHVLLLYLFARDHPAGLFPIGLPLTVWLLFSVVHLVVCIHGGARCLQRRVSRANGINIFRGRPC